MYTFPGQKKIISSRIISALLKKNQNESLLNSPIDTPGFTQENRY